MEIDILLLVLRWFHLAAAITAIGGAIFMRRALMPAVKSTLDDEQHKRLREAIRARWAPVVHAAIAILVVTGVINFVRLAMPPKVEPMPYHAIFAFKFLAALGVFFIASMLMGRSSASESFRRKASKWLNVLVMLGLLIVLLSGLLLQVRGQQTHAQPSSAPATSASALEP